MVDAYYSDQGEPYDYYEWDELNEIYYDVDWRLPEKITISKCPPRTSRDIWFLDIAKRCAQQSTCLRRKFGAVIVNDRGHIIATGYNGSPVKMPECQVCWRETHNIPSGEMYERCCSVHSEQNALLQAGRDAYRSIMYIDGIDAKTGEHADAKPCLLCVKMMINSGIYEFKIRDETGTLYTYRPEYWYSIREKEMMRHE
jgi:dCMP deaminase